MAVARDVSRRDLALPPARLLDARNGAVPGVRAFYELATGTPYAVGSAEGCCGFVRDEVQGIRIAHSSLSRIHALIEPYREGWTVIDVGSTNGVCVNDEHVLERTLRPGDRVRFGEAELIFREEPI